VKKLINGGVLVQEVVTVFRQVVVQQGNTDVANAVFDQVARVSQEVFNKALAMRSNWLHKIEPKQERVVSATVAAVAEAQVEAEAGASPAGSSPAAASSAHDGDGQPVGDEPSLLDEHIDVEAIPERDAADNKVPF
jgi:hypothetical protein